MPRLLIATKNSHKTSEIRAILGNTWEVLDLDHYPEIEAPEETGTTFAENAGIKAAAASRLFTGLVLSDDSGLEVDALDGEPGVYSARYAGRNATDAANRDKLIRELSSRVSGTKPWAARFRCVMAVAEGGEVLETFCGTSEGIIVECEKGEWGFGYDALFIPSGHSETFAQLSAEAKNRLSHRARALAPAIEYITRRLEQHPEM